MITLCIFFCSIILCNYMYSIDENISEEPTPNRTSSHKPLQDITHEQLIRENSIQHIQDQMLRKPAKSQQTHIEDLQNNAHQWKVNLDEANQFTKAQRHLVENGHSKELTIDPYNTLEIPQNATNDQIRRAYKKFSLKYHPDKNSTPEAEERFKEVSNAYTVLTTPELKASYDIYKKFESTQKNRFNGTHDPLDAIPEILDQAADIISIIDKHLNKLKNGTATHEETNQLDDILKQQYKDLVTMIDTSKSTIVLDNTSLKKEIKTWAKNMLEHIHNIQDELSPQQIAQKELAQSFETQERLDYDYNNWLYEDSSHLISPVHNNNRTPLQEALAAHSIKMAQTILQAARYHNVPIKELLAPITQEYTRLIKEGKRQEAENLENEIYKINDNELSKSFYKAITKINKS